jgi:PhnB protein
MATINSYINFNGNCEEAFNYYKEVFGGEFSMLSRFSEMPPQEGMELSEGDMNKIMHVSMPIGKEAVLMGSDVGGEWAPELRVGNNITLSITADSKEQADRFFYMLSEGGVVIMPMDKTFWGSYFGMCTDKFDINWMISFGEAPQE